MLLLLIPTIEKEINENSLILKSLKKFIGKQSKTLNCYFSIRLESLPQKSLPWKPQCGNGQPEAVVGKVLAAKFLVSGPGLACSVGPSDTQCRQGIRIPPAVAVDLSTDSAD